MKEEPRWHASLAVVAALAFYMALPGKLTFGPVWMAPVLIALLLVPLSIVAPHRHLETPGQRAASIALIAILNFFNAVSAVLLVVDLVYAKSTHHGISAVELLRAGGQVWSANILVFALWFWEVDGGGPEPRAHVAASTEFRRADFLFPQMQLNRDRVHPSQQLWKPMFLDYLYLSFTNALAFSPTDTMPLTKTAKMLMLAESLISFVTIALILARSVNILT